jgi:hypothetical protein
MQQPPVPQPEFTLKDRPGFEHVWLSLQWHAGFAGVGRGWDRNMISQIEQLGREGFELVTVVPQSNPTWYILFFKRQIL